MQVDAPVYTVGVDHYEGPAGCPPKQVSGPSIRQTTDLGIATTDVAIPGVENKAHVFGHSRWQGVQGVFFAIQYLSDGDKILVDGIDRNTGEQYEGLSLK